MSAKDKVRKGAIFGLAFFFLIGLIAVVSAWLFFIFFKVHITSIAVDVDSINRYQEVPTTVLGTTLFVEDSTQDGLTAEADKRNKNKINCFRGDGPAGSHGINSDLCTKQVAFFVSKAANKVGEKILSTPSDFRLNLVTSLPTSCYSLSLKFDGSPVDELRDSGIAGCNLDLPKLSEDYPIPIFSGAVPAVAAQTLIIGSSLSSGQELLVNWPRYGTCFADQPNCLPKEVPADAE